VDTLWRSDPWAGLARKHRRAREKDQRSFCATGRACNCTISAGADRRLERPGRGNLLQEYLYFLRATLWCRKSVRLARLRGAAVLRVTPWFRYRQGAWALW